MKLGNPPSLNTQSNPTFSSCLGCLSRSRWITKGLQIDQSWSSQPNCTYMHVAVYRLYMVTKYLLTRQPLLGTLQTSYKLIYLSKWYLHKISSLFPTKSIFPNSPPPPPLRSTWNDSWRFRLQHELSFPNVVVSNCSKTFTFWPQKSQQKNCIFWKCLKQHNHRPETGWWLRRLFIFDDFDLRNLQ